MLEKEKGEVDFLHLDKHETSLQVDAINLGGHDQTCQNSKFATNIFSQEKWDEVEFLCS